MEKIINKERLVGFVQAASRAPSSHNTQPWKFKLHISDDGKSGMIQVFADGSRRLKLTDVDGRELLISVGATITNLRVAAEADGFLTEVETTEIKDVLSMEQFEVAKVHIKPSTGTSSKSSYPDLTDQISRRVTCRKPFKVEPLQPEMLDEIRRAVESEGAWLQIVSDSQEIKSNVCNMILDANDVQWQDSKWRSELANWIRPFSSGDGLHIGPGLFCPITRWIVRTFKSTGDSQGHTDRELAMSSPHLAVLGVDEGTPAMWIKAGQALQHGLLVAAKHDVFASYFNQPLQVKEFRGLQFAETIRRETGSSCLLLRLGRVHNPAQARANRSARRPVEDIIIM